MGWDSARPGRDARAMKAPGTGGLLQSPANSPIPRKSSRVRAGPAIGSIPSAWGRVNAVRNGRWSVSGGQPQAGQVTAAGRAHGRLIRLHPSAFILPDAPLVAKLLLAVLLFVGCRWLLL